MNLVLQVLVFIFGLTYKYYLAKEKFVGWILAAATSISSIIFLSIYMPLPILICLESSFLCLSFYGMYKHRRKQNDFTWIDWVIIILTAFVILFLVWQQLETNSVWYEIIASIGFLSGMVFLAQKRDLWKIFGWMLFAVASISLAILMSLRHFYVLCAVDGISVLLSVYAISKIVKKKAP